MTQPALPPFLRGVVVDLDGLLIDSEIWSWQAHDLALAAFAQPPLALEEIRRLVGLDSADEWITLRELRTLPADRRSYMAAQREAFIDLRNRNLAPLPGVRELLHVVTQRGLRLGLASNSALPSVTAALQGLGIRSHFAAIASADEVPHGKPAPDPYLLALHRLGLEAAQAIAVEDSETGLRAARAAGLFAVVVPSVLTSVQDLSSAQARFESLRDMAAWLQAGTSDAIRD